LVLILQEDPPPPDGPAPAEPGFVTSADSPTTAPVSWPRATPPRAGGRLTGSSGSTREWADGPPVHALVHRGGDAGNPDPCAIRLVLASRSLAPRTLDAVHDVS